TVAETEELLSAHEVRLRQSAIAELHAITEGWPAALRLSAMAMRRYPEPEQLLAGLGSDDLVADYVRREVLAKMPPETYQLLLELAVSDQLTASLVEGLTGRGGGASKLAELRQRGVFGQPYAGTCGWYRFHPLLSRILYCELARDDPLRAHQA